jgi:tRNA(Arg) A34 adenosine deaminase TadA
MGTSERGILMSQEDEKFIRQANHLAELAAGQGNHPFGALLVMDGKVILTAENTVKTDHDVTRHAELNLVSMACRKFDPETLAKCTLYTSTEPCAMCTGAIYWAGISKVVYGCPAEALGEIRHSPFVFPSRALLAHGDRKVEVVGPVLEEESSQLHYHLWK